MAPKSPPPGVRVTYSQQYRRCRKPGCALCRDGGSGHGPYWFAYWRESGKLRSLYLGKQRPPEATPPEAVPPAARATEAPGTALPRLRVRTLGGLAIWRAEQPIAAEALRRRKVLSLLTSLLSAPAFQLSREALYEVLWPDAEPEAAARNLHATLHLLRKALDEPDAALSVIRLAGEMVVLDLGDAEHGAEQWLDAAAFQRAAATALRGRDRLSCREALALYGGDYVPEEPYADWVAARREELRACYLALRLHLAALSSAAGDQQEAEQCYRAVLAQDNCHEDAALALMNVLVSQGRRSEALKVYQALATALEAELDLAPSDAIEALRARILALDAAPRAVDVAPRNPSSSQIGNLPVSLTSFVGRSWELQEIGALLTTAPDQGGARLLTLTALGGGGKTRLALAVAQSLAPHFVDGTWLVELAALSSAAAVPLALARTLGLRETAGSSVSEMLRDFLRPRRVLLILDTCEHLRDACAELADALLRGCPDLRLLATSRLPLAVLGEQVWRVPSLTLPPSGPTADLEAVARSESVRLFVERARAGRPQFTLTAANAPLVAGICRRLDGLPLAIELAAARLATIPLERISARLDDRFAFLTAGNRAALPRQQTLQATMDWSYELLSPQERVLLARLSVFQGGWTLEAAEAVCADPPSTGVSLNGPQLDVDLLADLLAGLVAHSLVQFSDSSEPARYTMLETVRDYAASRLQDSEALIRTRHAGWYTAQVQQFLARVSTPERGLWLQRLDDELGNIRAALHFTLAQEDAAVPALRFTESLLYFWLLRGHLSEGRRWLQAALARGSAAPPALRARALNALASLANEQGDSAQALASYDESLTLFRAAGDERAAASVLVNQGNAAKYRGDFDLARERYAEGIRLLRALDDQATLSIVLNNLGALYLDLGDPEQALGPLEDSLAIKRALGNPQGIARPLGNLAEVARLRGDFARATALYAEYQTLARTLGDTISIAVACYNLGLIAQAEGRLAQAAGLFAESLALERDLENRRHIAHCLEGLAAIAARVASPDLGARFFAAASVLREAIGAPVTPADLAEHQRSAALLRSSLGGGAARAWAAGAAMPLDEVIAAALRFGREVQERGAP